MTTSQQVEEYSNHLNKIYLAITNKTDYECFLKDIRSSSRLRFLLEDFLSHCEEKPGTYLVEIKNGVPRLLF